MELTNRYEENVVVEVAGSETMDFAVEETSCSILLETGKIEQLQITCYKLFLATNRVSALNLRAARLRTGRCTMNRILIRPIVAKPLPGSRMQMARVSIRLTNWRRRT